MNESIMNPLECRTKITDKSLSACLYIAWSLTIEAVSQHAVVTHPSGPKGDQGAVGKTGDKGDKGQDGKSGVKYVRWGKTTCPRGADIVYKGMRIK